MFAFSTPLIEGLAVNRTALPPGKTCGQRCVCSPGPSFVKGRGSPPAPGILDSPVVWLSAATILPFSSQLPPVSNELVLASITAAPPSIEILCRCDFAKNPMDCPSGEKNGACPSSVPESRVGCD